MAAVDWDPPKILRFLFGHPSVILRLFGLKHPSLPRRTEGKPKNNRRIWLRKPREQWSQTDGKDRLGSVWGAAFGRSKSGRGTTGCPAASIALRKDCSSLGTGAARPGYTKPPGFGPGHGLEAAAARCSRRIFRIKSRRPSGGGGAGRAGRRWGTTGARCAPRPVPRRKRRSR